MQYPHQASVSLVALYDQLSHVLLPKVFNFLFISCSILKLTKIQSDIVSKEVATSASLRPANYFPLLFASLKVWAPMPFLINLAAIVNQNEKNLSDFQGGYRLVLLDSKGEIVEQLAPVNGLEYAGLEDQT